MADIVFRFAKRPTIGDTDSVTSCVLNRHLVNEHVNGYYKRAQNFLVGYNLTVGVKEYRSGLDYWKGVEYVVSHSLAFITEYENTRTTTQLLLR